MKPYIVFYSYNDKYYAGEVIKTSISVATTNTLLHIKPFLLNRSIVILEQTKQISITNINIDYNKLRIYQNIIGKCVLIYDDGKILIELMLDSIVINDMTKPMLFNQFTSIIEKSR